MNNLNAEKLMLTREAWERVTKKLDEAFREEHLTTPAVLLICGTIFRSAVESGHISKKEAIKLLEVTLTGIDASLQ